MFKDLVGHSYKFEDGHTIKIIQLNPRDNGIWITYEITSGPGIPQKLMMIEREFYNNFGHLFGIKDAPERL
jgi:hypothetical protein